MKFQCLSQDSASGVLETPESKIRQGGGCMKGRLHEKRLPCFTVCFLRTSSEMVNFPAPGLKGDSMSEGSHGTRLTPLCPDACSQTLGDFARQLSPDS